MDIQVDQLLTLSEPYTFKNGVFNNMLVCPGHKSADGPITNYYTVEFQEMGGALIPDVVVNGTFRASGHTSYTNYTFRVAGVNEAGTGPIINVTSNYINLIKIIMMIMQAKKG